MIYQSDFEILKYSQLLCDLIGFVTLDIALIFISLMNGILNSEIFSVNYFCCRL